MEQEELKVGVWLGREICRGSPQFDEDLSLNDNGGTGENFAISPHRVGSSGRGV